MMIRAIVENDVLINLAMERFGACHSNARKRRGEDKVMM